MENYEINILKRNGDWKKINPNDTLLETINKENDEKTNVDKSFLTYINQINLIINKLENLENKKNNLKSQLKTFEEEFQNKKKNTEYKMEKMNQEVQILSKAIGVIKNLKTF